MNELINWVARNNTLMIQSGFTIVLLLLVVYIYRLFFVSTGATSGATGDVNQLNDKIEQLLQQKLSPSAGGTAGGAESAGEIERLRAEITTLKATLNESEKKVFELTPTTDQGALEANNINQEQILELTKKIENLEARLAEYDIISDDIAELSQLRAENSEMKSKLGAAGTEASSPPITKDSAESEDLEVDADFTQQEESPPPDVSTELVSEENIYEAAQADPILTEDEALPDLNLDPITTEPLPEISLESDPIIAEEVINEEVADNDKTILDDFEKIVKRSST